MQDFFAVIVGNTIESMGILIHSLPFRMPFLDIKTKAFRSAIPFVVLTLPADRWQC